MEILNGKHDNKIIFRLQYLGYNSDNTKHCAAISRAWLMHSCVIKISLSSSFLIKSQMANKIGLVDFIVKGTIRHMQ